VTPDIEEILSIERAIDQSFIYRQLETARWSGNKLYIQFAGRAFIRLQPFY